MIIAALFFARTILIPVALAVLLAFFLAPLVDRFERWGFGKLASVVVVTVLAFALLAGVGYGLFKQLARVGDDLPLYGSNVRKRVAAARQVVHGTFLDRVKSTADDVMTELNRADRAPAGAQAAAPRQVVVAESSVLWQLPSVLESLSSAGLVVVLVIFMLIERRQLRNRLLRIAGLAHVAMTTRALDEASQRISRYLLMQTMINASFGVVIGLALFLIGLPYALLCGFLAAALRFIPYVGPIVGGGFPVVLSLAMLPGWHGPLFVIALVVVAELVCNLILEPWLYGQSAGVSQVALLVAIAFWTWLWGPVGLIVATPLTVCLVVLSRHVPEMEFFAILLGDEPPLDLHQRFYQRLLADDADEAEEIAHEFAGLRPSENLYDELLLPTLVRMRADREDLRISAMDEERVVRAARQVVDALEAKQSHSPLFSEVAGIETGGVPVRVLAYGADGEIDDLAVSMLRNLVASPGVGIVFSCSGSGDLIEWPRPSTGEAPTLACIVTISRAGIGAARRLVQRLRRSAPATQVLVGRVAARGA